jgi:hypothetical protein
MMRTVDRRRVEAPLASVFAAAADVERWPDLLAHYRWVRMLERRGDRGVVEMTIDRAAPAVRDRHIRGITTGMDVEWSFADLGRGGTEVTIVHEWAGPPWPLIRRPVAEWVIGPVFVHGIASRTLAGLGGWLEGEGQGSGVRGLSVRADSE